jgi:hypothetical protein
MQRSLLLKRRLDVVCVKVTRELLADSNSSLDAYNSDMTAMLYKSRSQK